MNQESLTLASLHSMVSGCNLCADMLDTSKVTRCSAAGPQQSSLFIVSQALARDTQRVSGIPYVLPSGVLSETGKSLERFLNRLGFSLLPTRKLMNGDIQISLAPNGCRQVYNSEIVQCFPGRLDAGEGDKFPTLAAKLCMEQQFLKLEIELVDPSVILLLGNNTAKWFQRYLVGKNMFHSTITSTLNRLDPDSSLVRIKIGRRIRYVVRLIHSSGMTRGKFRDLVENNTNLVSAVRNHLVLAE